MQETPIRSLVWEDSLKKGMATHSSTFAWRIPWTKEVDGLQSMGFQRIGPDWATNIHFIICYTLISADGKASVYNAGDPGSIPGLGRSPGEGNGNLLLYSCQENPRDRGAWRATAHGVTKSPTQLSNWAWKSKLMLEESIRPHEYRGWASISILLEFKAHNPTLPCRKIPLQP